MKIAFIGFGEAGRAFADSLRAAGDGEIAAYDRLDTPEMALAMAGRAVRRGQDPGTPCATADWIISAVTADQSLEARAVAGAASGAGAGRVRHQLGLARAASARRRPRSKARARATSTWR